MRDSGLASGLDADLPSPNVSIIYHEGRPTEEQLFKDAHSAVEPGMFKRGQTRLTSMVKRVASKVHTLD